MFSNDDDNQGVVLGVLFGVIALVIGLVIGVGIYKTNQMAAPKAAPVADVVADGTSIRVENGVVKFYFATAKADLASGANEALRHVVMAVAEGKKALVSGFHDSTGDLAKNEELAKLRAFAVRDALKSLGVAEDKIELKKPEVMTGTGSNAEARRVEVTVN
ncbi:MAG: OmpA family protein [Betaproteobacteria bacterium]|nr:OmpA family protein [Betaproteobacteria bacterium]